VPKLLPVTGSFAPAFAAYYFLLNMRVSLSRVETDTMIGTEPSKTKASSKDSKSDSNSLLLNSRCQGNFVENVPLALLLASIVEVNGGSRRLLTGSLGALLFFRIVHVEFGLRVPGNKGWGRPLGHFGTMGWMLGMSSYGAWLVKSYWGF